MNTQDIWNFITTQGVDFGIKLLRPSSPGSSAAG